MDNFVVVLSFILGFVSNAILGRMILLNRRRQIQRVVNNLWGKKR